MRRMKTPILNIAQGQAGVHRVVSDLIVRGYAPYLPVVDTGVDILLAGNVRLQVKTTLRESKHWRLSEGTFLFTLSKAAVIRKQKYVSSSARMFSEHCDFVVLVALEADRVWIVPAAVLDDRHTATISSTKQWKDFDGDQVTALKAQGKTIAEIARHLNVAPRTVTRRMTTHTEPKRKFSNLPEYENRWDLIAGHLATMTEATQIVETPAGVPVTT